MKSKFHEDFYSFAKYYDIAFDFKDIPVECSFFKELAVKHLNRPLSSFIEFGAGPALHCMELAKELPLVTAVDLSPEMTEYAKSKAMNLGISVNCDCADMPMEASKWEESEICQAGSSSYLARKKSDGSVSLFFTKINGRIALSRSQVNLDSSFAWPISRATQNGVFTAKLDSLIDRGITVSVTLEGQRRMLTIQEPTETTNEKIECELNK